MTDLTIASTEKGQGNEITVQSDITLLGNLLMLGSGNRNEDKQR